jgi:hypothetical protein
MVDGNMNGAIKVIPVLKLDDDNHTPCYVSLTNYWSDADSFIQDVLCKPHEEIYSIKEIEGVWLKEDGKHNGMSYWEMFDRVDDHRMLYFSSRLTEEDLKKREEAFWFFYRASKEELYGWN